MSSETLQQIQVGQQVPNFSEEALLPDGSFKKIQLSDYQGKWLVVFFYPLDFTFVCPTEIKGFNSHYDKLKASGAEVISVSTDSVYSHKAWTEHGLGKIHFPMLADTAHKVSRIFNVLLEDKGVSLRGTFIIDPKGVLKSAVVNDLSVGRSVEETLRTLQALQTGKLTGCDWKPGQPTL